MLYFEVVKAFILFGCELLLPGVCFWRVFDPQIPSWVSARHMPAAANSGHSSSHSAAVGDFSLLIYSRPGER